MLYYYDLQKILQTESGYLENNQTSAWNILLNFLCMQNDNS